MPGPVKCNAWLVAEPLLADGYHQAIGIDVLRDSGAENLLRFLNARHFLRHQPLMEII